jgi:hypothetical protein
MLRVSQEVRGITRRTTSSFTYKIMKTRFSLRTGLAGLALMLAASFATSSSTFANETPADVAADSAASVAAYPLTTCVVSGDKLEDGDMGPPINYVYKEAGKPDRLVRLCCKGCIKKFNKEPAKYLKMIDDAAAAKAKGAAPAGTDGHTGHSH